MNTVQEIQRINEAELASGSLASWHDQYKDSAYIHVGGLPYQLTEGDVITIFSQYGEVVDVTMPRDQNTQKPRGFAFLMYADQRSTVLAVDNLGGAKVLDRTLKVDHVLNYKQLERDNETGKMKERETQSLAAHPDKFRHALKTGSDDGGSDSDSSHPSIDADDPMRDYLIEQKRAARKAAGGSLSKKRKHDGESKEEKQARKEARARQREERAKRKSLKAGESSRSKSKRVEDGRGGDRDRSRDEPRDRSPPRRRPDERDYDSRRGDPAPRERDRDDDRARGARSERERDRGHDHRPRDDEYRRRPSGKSSAFADLEKWATGR